MKQRTRVSTIHCLSNSSILLSASRTLQDVRLTDSVSPRSGAMSFSQAVALLHSSVLKHVQSNREVRSITMSTTLNGHQALLAEALKKVEETEVPELKKIAIAFSGGLDSTLCIVLAREKYGAEVVPITVDVGQGKEEIAQSISQGRRARD